MQACKIFIALATGWIRTQVHLSLYNNPLPNQSRVQSGSRNDAKKLMGWKSQYWTGDKKGQICHIDDTWP